MKLIYYIIPLSLSVASCEEVAYPAKFTVDVDNEVGDPVPYVPVKAWTFLRWVPGQGFGKDIADRREQDTNLQGRTVFDFPSKRGTFSIHVEGGNEFYGSSGLHYKFKEVVGGKWIPENPTIPYVLKRKRNPIPLYAKTYYLNPTAIPIKNTDCGYDLEKGDWVTPHGKGVAGDIVFHLEVRRDNGVNDNDCNLRVSFSNEGDGLVCSPKPLNEGSELRLDYLAPEGGYNPTLSMRAFTDLAEKASHEGFERTQNYFLRVRTKLDEDGKVIRANYAKVHGDFEFWYTGDMRFTYYFNPIANDRNLEFGIERNLFTNLEDAKKVYQP